MTNKMISHNIKTMKSESDEIELIGMKLGDTQVNSENSEKYGKPYSMFKVKMTKEDKEK